MIAPRRESTFPELVKTQRKQSGCWFRWSRRTRAQDRRAFGQIGCWSEADREAGVFDTIAWISLAIAFVGAIVNHNR